MVTDTQVEQEAFEAKLEELLDGMSGGQLLAIPGLYEVVSEHLNNAVLEALEVDAGLDPGDE